MPFNLLIFPLVGGYYFIVRARLCKFWQQRIERQRLIFNSIIVGAILLSISFILSLVARSFLAPEVIQAITKASPLTLPFFWTAFASFIIGIISAEASNFFVGREKAIKWAIDFIGNELELLFKNSWEDGNLIQITLTNNKVYVGWVKTLPIPSHSSYLSILPAFSGYREDEKKEIHFTTQYLDVYASYVQDGVTDINALTTQIIKIEEIISVSSFDSDMWDRFHAVNKGVSASAN